MSQSHRYTIDDLISRILRGDFSGTSKILKSGDIKNINDVSSDPVNLQSTPLTEACGEHQTEIVELLLMHGAELDAPDGWGVLPIHHACSTSRTRRDDTHPTKDDVLETLELLLRSKADVDAETKSKCTPLMMAAADAAPDIVKFLLEAKARASTEDSRGKDALAYMAEAKDDPDEGGAEEWQAGDEERVTTLITDAIELEKAMQPDEKKEPHSPRMRGKS